MRAVMCNSRKYPYLSQGGSLEIPRGRRSQKLKLLKESMKQKTGIWVGVETKKKPSVGGVWKIFSGTKQYFFLWSVKLIYAN